MEAVSKKLARPVTEHGHGREPDAVAQTPRVLVNDSLVNLLAHPGVRVHRDIGESKHTTLGHLIKRYRWPRRQLGRHSNRLRNQSRGFVPPADDSRRAHTRQRSMGNAATPPPWTSHCGLRAESRRQAPRAAPPISVGRAVVSFARGRRQRSLPRGTPAAATDLLSRALPAVDGASITIRNRQLGDDAVP